MSRLNHSTVAEDDTRSVFNSSFQLDPVPPTQTFTAPSANRTRGLGQSSFTLTTLFQIITGCCIFFAVLQSSPLFAIIGTVILTPAIVRTAIASDTYFKKGIRFSLYRRVQYLFESTGLTVVSLFFSVVVFALISLTFGLLSAILANVMGVTSMTRDIAIVGTVCGMIWGGTAGLIVLGLCIRKWFTSAAVEAYEESPAESKTANWRLPLKLF